VCGKYNQSFQYSNTPVKYFFLFYGKDKILVKHSLYLIINLIRVEHI